jgi:hypothetical protein
MNHDARFGDRLAGVSVLYQNFFVFFQKLIFLISILTLVRVLIKQMSHYKLHQLSDLACAIIAAIRDGRLGEIASLQDEMELRLANMSEQQRLKMQAASKQASEIVDKAFYDAHSIVKEAAFEVEKEPIQPAKESRLPANVFKRELSAVGEAQQKLMLAKDAFIDARQALHITRDTVLKFSTTRTHVTLTEQHKFLTVCLEAITRESGDLEELLAEVKNSQGWVQGLLTENEDMQAAEEMSTKKTRELLTLIGRQA